MKINFNWNKSELKDGADAVRLILHTLDNTKRKDSREKLNPNPELEDIVLKQINKNFKKEMKEFKKTAQRGGKGAKPYRFLVSTLNIAPTKANEAIINEWAKEIFKLFSKYFNIEHFQVHLNETHPHVHIIVKNYDKKLGWGNYVNGKKVAVSGDQGKINLHAVWKEGEEINKKLAQKYNLEFAQEPQTDKGMDRTIEKFRKSVCKTKLSNSDKRNIENFFKTEYGKKFIKFVEVEKIKEIVKVKDIDEVPKLQSMLMSIYDLKELRGKSAKQLWEMVNDNLTAFKNTASQKHNLDKEVKELKEKNERLAFDLKHNKPQLSLEQFKKLEFFDFIEKTFNYHTQFDSSKETFASFGSAIANEYIDRFKNEEMEPPQIQKRK